jgi:hypothetical protein
MAARKSSTGTSSSSGSSAAGTKKRVQKAYQEAAEAVEAQEELVARSEQESVSRRQQEAVQVATELGENALGVQEIFQLKSNLGKMLGQLADQLESELQNFQTVQKAVAAKETELKEFYEIEKNANTLAALVEAQNREKSAFDEEMAEQREALDAEIAATRERWQKEKAEYDLALKVQREADKKQREREREEYDYTFKREQALARHAFADEKAAQEKELLTIRETTEKELAEREKAIVLREVEYKELRAAVEKLTKERDAIVKQAVETMRERLVGEHKSQVELMQKSFEGERSVLATKIEALDKAVNDQAAQITKYTSQLDAAYGKVQDIAVKALEGTANAKTLQGLQSLLADSVRSGKLSAEK